MTISHAISDHTARSYWQNGKQFEKVKGEKDLGVTIDSKFSFESHIFKKLKRSAQLLPFSRRLLKETQAWFLKICKGLIQPHLEYCNQVCHPRLKKYVTLTENVQRRAA